MPDLPETPGPLPDEELESLLRSLPLHKPSDQLDRRVLAMTLRLQVGGTSMRLWLRTGALLAACIALVVLVALALNNRDPLDPAGSQANSQTGTDIAAEFKPVRIEEIWSSVQPQDVVDVDDTAMRRYVKRTYERVELVDEKNNIRIEYTQPRRELIVTPARFD